MVKRVDPGLWSCIICAVTGALSMLPQGAAAFFGFSVFMIMEIVPAMFFGHLLAMGIRNKVGHGYEGRARGFWIIGFWVSTVAGQVLVLVIMLSLSKPMVRPL